MSAREHINDATHGTGPDGRCRGCDLLNAASLPPEVMLAALEDKWSLVRLPALSADRPGWRRYLLTWEALP